MSERPSSLLLEKMKNSGAFRAEFADLYDGKSVSAQSVDSCVKPSQLSLSKQGASSTGSASSSEFRPTKETAHAAITQSKSASSLSTSNAASSVLSNHHSDVLERNLRDGSGISGSLNGKPFTMADVLGSSSSSSSSSSSQQQCSSCSCASNHNKDTSSNNNNNNRKTDADMKTFAYGTKLSESFWTESCSIKCECGRDCLQVFSVSDIATIKKQFWGSPTDQVFPTRTERNASIAALFDKAGYNPKTEQFSFPFSAGKAAGGQRHVCHKAAVLLLGLTNSTAGTSRQWDAVAKQKLDEKRGKPSVVDAAIPKHAPQTDSVKVWLKCISGQADHAVGAGLEEKCILPAHTPSHLFKLYEASEKADGVSPENIACRRTFTNYWKAEGSTMYSLLTCKGGFPTCEICNHA